jgi:hypothetical protein
MWVKTIYLILALALTLTAVFFLEVNTHMGTLDYFMNDKHFKDRVVNIPKDVYFGV